MSHLPVIVGFGGINSAGRSSFHQSYRRLVIDALPSDIADETWLDLANLMNLTDDEGAPLSAVDTESREYINRHTLIRKLEDFLFDGEHVPWNKRLTISPDDDTPINFIVPKKQLPDPLPVGWTVSTVDDGQVRVNIDRGYELLIPSERRSEVNAAGQLPTGFEPRFLYPSRNHPRGLQMTVYGASDALQSMGIDWEDIRQRVNPDQISVYAGSGMSQLDLNGNGGMIMSRMNGKRVTSKQCPFGFAEMPADFINAYLLGSVGSTGTSMGACASFLYNLRQGLGDIQTGRSRVVVVGNAEAPITPEVIEGYAAMGALATDRELAQLDGLAIGAEPDYRRACRPFGDNRGFTLGEAAQFLVLFDDELALEMGATIHGAVSDVFVNADGYKKSISSPGIGNYITVAKAASAARAIVGEQSISQRSFIQAHGTGTPQNRVTESHILNEVAKSFGMTEWPVAAVKSYLGHSIGVAGGDQIIASLGVWQYGLIPGISTIDSIADDVHHTCLSLSNEHTEVNPKEIDVALINAKGFGGNNASASLLAPHIVQKMLAKKHGEKAFASYQQANEPVTEKAATYNHAAISGKAKPRYLFDNNVLHGEDITFSNQAMDIPGFEHSIDLNLETPYKDMV